MVFLLACVDAESGKAADSSGDVVHPAETGETGDSAETAGTGDSEDTGESGETAETGDSGDTTAPPITGPCAVYADAVSTGVVLDPALDELSGLAVSRQNPGILWTHEDSGGAAALYALDATGATVATLTLDGVSNEDWEDLAIAPCDAGWCLAVGDTGTLGTDRADFSLLVVPEPRLDGATAYSATPTIFPFTYPGDPEDAESLALFPDGTPLIVSKREDATAGLYTLGPGDTVLTDHGDVITGAEGEALIAAATAADLSTDGATLLLRTYFHLYEVDVRDLDAPGEPTPVDYALEVQGEAVAYDPLLGGFWQVAEGAGPDLWYTGCVE